jgi:glycosyltransferase involved in cell wall biosynthesis
VIGLQPWYFEIGSNCKNIALQLSLHNRVLYVNTPVNRKTYYSKNNSEGVQEHIRIIRDKDQRIHPISENLWQFYPACVVESINWLPSTAAFKTLNSINNSRFARQVKEATQEMGFKDFILFNDNDFINGYDLKKLLEPAVYVYYCRDYLRATAYFGKHGNVLEPEVIKKADLAVANSGYLAQYCAKHNPDSYYIGQGCNIELFDREKNHPVPDELKGMRSPVIGYVGAVISSRLDENIIRILAEAHPEWNIVLVGPEDEHFKNSSLHKMPNVHFIGRRPLESLPHYVNCFDVCINPQLVNQLTIGNYPLKVDEYLAMGKPVVATRTETMDLFADYTYLADTPENYPSLVEKALLENSETVAVKRAAFARTHTWENSVGELSDRIEQKENIKASQYGNRSREATEVGSYH